MVKLLTHLVKKLLKNEPKAAPEKKPVQYTADIIVEIKNRDGTVVPIKALLDTGTTSENLWTWAEPVPTQIK
jgi:hypothetical protein